MIRDKEYFEQLWEAGGWHFAIRRSQIYRYEKYCEMLKQTINDKTLRVLEVGCGEGFFTARYLGNMFSDVTGVDISETAITKARKLYPHLRFFVDALPKLALMGDERFSLITMHECLYYISEEEQSSAVQRAYDLLRKGGWLMLSGSQGDGYPTPAEFRALLDGRFRIKQENVICLRQYSRYFESVLVHFYQRTFPSFWGREVEHPSWRHLVGKLVLDNPLARTLYNPFLQRICEAVLRHVPIPWVDWLGHRINLKKNISIYMCMAQKGE